jgi:hypothetical protein
LMIEDPDPYLWLTDPDPGSPKKSGSYGRITYRIRGTILYGI